MTWLMGAIVVPELKILSKCLIYSVVSNYVSAYSAKVIQKIEGSYKKSYNLSDASPELKWQPWPSQVRSRHCSSGTLGSVELCLKPDSTSHPIRGSNSRGRPRLGPEFGARGGMREGEAGLQAPYRTSCPQGIPAGVV